MGATSQKRWGKATIVDVCDVAQHIRQVVLEPAESGPAPPPGSHLDIEVYVNGSRDLRSYSIVGAGPYGYQLVLGVQLARQSRGGSAYMHSLRRGAQVTVTQPLNPVPSCHLLPSVPARFTTYSSSDPFETPKTGVW